MLKKHNNDCSTLSAVKNAGKIIVLDHGQVIEQGTHEELLEKKYYSMWNAGKQD